MNTMTAKVAEMVLDFLRKEGNDTERTSKFMAYTLRIGPVGECRKIIRDAQVFKLNESLKGLGHVGESWAERYGDTVLGDMVPKIK